MATRCWFVGLAAGGWGRPAAAQGVRPPPVPWMGSREEQALELCWSQSQQQLREPGTQLGDGAARSRCLCCSSWGSTDLHGHPGSGVWGAVLSLGPSICGAARFGMSVWEGGMLQRREHGAPCTDLAPAVPWREWGLWGTHCRWLSPPKFSSPKHLTPAGRGCIWQRQPWGPAWLVQLAGLEPRGHIQPQPLHPPSQPWHLCKAMALPSRILFQPPSPWRGEAQRGLLDIFMIWGMRGRVQPSSCWGKVAVAVWRTCCLC